MRQKNRLYTVNKFNRPAFIPKENIYDGLTMPSNFLGGSNSALNNMMQTSNLAAPTTPNFNMGTATGRAGAIGTSAGMVNNFNANTTQMLQNQGWSGIGTAVGGGGKGAGLAATAKGIADIGINMADSIGKSESNPRGLYDIADPLHHLAGGRESTVGNAFSDMGVATFKAGAQSGNAPMMIAGAVMKGVGSLTNAAIGMKTDKALLKGVNEGIQQNKNFESNKKHLDDIQGPAAVITNTDVYKGGWFTGGKARRKNRELKEAMIAARSFAGRSVDNNIDNLVDDQLNNELANYSAFGGPIDFGGGALGLMQQNRYFDTIDKRSEAIAGKGQNMQTGFTGGAKSFADGGLKAAFLDTFGKDPIGAAVRYNQGLEALAAQEEANKIEAEREAEYLAMQKRLADLETTQQGLQALVTAQRQNEYPLTPDEVYMSEASASSSSPSRAAYNSNWDYIEDQLKRSGKFNDVQIKGIKYNLQRESSLDPTIVGDGGAAFGLGQWHGSRKPKDMSLEGQTKHLIDTISNFDGKEHWIRKRDYEGFLNARTPEEAHYYLAKGYERPRADIVAKVKRDSDMSLKRLNAFGGNIRRNYSVGDVIDVTEEQAKKLKSLGYEFKIIG